MSSDVYKRNKYGQEENDYNYGCQIEINIYTVKCNMFL